MKSLGVRICVLALLWSSWLSVPTRASFFFDERPTCTSFVISTKDECMTIRNWCAWVENRRMCVEYDPCDRTGITGFGNRTYFTDYHSCNTKRAQWAGADAAVIIAIIAGTCLVLICCVFMMWSAWTWIQKKRAKRRLNDLEMANTDTSRNSLVGHSPKRKGRRD